MKKGIVRFYLKNKKVRTYLIKSSLRRVLPKVDRIDFEKGYVRVDYGKFPNFKDEPTNFYNSGYYDNKQDLTQAIQAFWNEG